MKKIVVAAGLAISFSTPVLAQHALVGKYSGSFAQTTSQGELHPGLTLEILAVEGDIVKGTAVRMALGPSRGCAGEYPVEGKVKGDTLALRATKKGGPAGDCDLTLRLKAEGNKLVGTMLNYKVELSK